MFEIMENDLKFVRYVTLDKTLRSSSVKHWYTYISRKFEINMLGIFETTEQIVPLQLFINQQKHDEIQMS